MAYYCYTHVIWIDQICKPFGIRIHIHKRASQKNGSAAALVMGGTGHHWSSLHLDGREEVLIKVVVATSHLHLA